MMMMMLTTRSHCTVCC